MTEISAEELGKMKERATAAQVELGRTCADNFTMRVHIPVQPDDTDEVIGLALSDGNRLIAAYEALQANLALVCAREPDLNGLWAELRRRSERAEKAEAKASALLHALAEPVDDATERAEKAEARVAVLREALDTYAQYGDMEVAMVSGIFARDVLAGLDPTADDLKRELGELRAMANAAASVLSEDGMREAVSHLVMGIELIERVDSWRGVRK